MNRRALLLISISSSLFAQVSFDRIMRADKERKTGSPIPAASRASDTAS